ncbi:MarR family winged helix-turn-helix transcriptional regulator [Muricoccus aerilatus]|uniref:MarR family winged helix-turn-helix transcriptional regulator n=1 Tax=Muricoccus aerilatus TaxID=452982 RepID=UPI000694C45C|nr:MarR family transcriptional regulator [Roseomonas aerilata]
MNDLDGPEGDGVLGGHGLLAGTVSYGLKRAYRRVIRDLEEALRPHDFTPPLLAALSIVAANPGIAPAHLAEAMGHGRSRAAPLLDRLEERGLLQRRTGADRRSLELHATPAGLDALGRLRPLLDAHEGRITDGLSADEAQALAGLLDRLAPGR